MNMNTAFKGFLNKFLGDTDGQEVNAMAEEVAVRLQKMFANGSDTAGNVTLPTRLGSRRTILSTQTANKTMLSGETGSFVRLQGDTTGLTITLPTSLTGVHYQFAIASQGDTAADITIKPAAGDRFVHDTLVMADGDAILSDANDTGAGVGGESIEVIGDGADWFITSLSGIFKVNTNP